MIFTILKVIGIILLVVLALILTALLCVLFVPVKYRAVGSFDNTDIRAKAHVSWLFHLFALHIEYADETDGYIRLAFVKKKTAFSAAVLTVIRAAFIVHGDVHALYKNRGVLHRAIRVFQTDVARFYRLNFAAVERDARFERILDKIFESCFSVFGYCFHNLFLFYHT